MFRQAIRPTSIVRPMLAMTRPRMLLYSTQAATKKLQSSSFSLPKDQPAPTHNDDVPHEDISDFNATKLIHGDTNLQIAITQRAREKLNLIAVEDKNANSALKIGVESGGCHGFQYNLTLTDLEKELLGDNASELLVFKRVDDDSKVAQVVLDPSSLEILQDLKIDFTKELIGSQFKVVDSPYTSTACGCGASFDFDFEKLEKKKAQEANN